MDKQFNYLINKYHPIQWLFKSVERTRNSNINDLDKRENLYAKPEFLIIMSDIAIRVSLNNSLKKNIPTHQEFTDFINLYINTQSNKAVSIKEHGLMALSLMIHEQVKFIYPDKNLLGRMLILYSQYEDEIKNFSGLKLNDILVIFLALMGQYLKSDFYVFGIENITHKDIDNLSSKNIQSFLDYFSITPRNYKLKLKELGFDKRKLYSFRLLERFPIVKFNENKYIVPCIENLLYSVTSNLNIHLLEYFNELDKGSKYHHQLGYKFESYIELLTKQVFSNILPAKDIVPKDTLNSEFVINYNNTSIAVEVKKFTFRRDTAFKNDIGDLDELLERHFVKAYTQIETTFKHIQEENKIGIIVVFGDLHMNTMIKDYLKKNYPKYYKKDKNGNITEEILVEYLENIIVMSVGTYESLMANTPDDILEILQEHLKKDINQRGDLIQTITSIGKESNNKFLVDAFDNAFESLELEKYR